MVIEEVFVSEHSPFANKTVGSSRIHHEYGVICLAIKRPGGKTKFNPTADAPILPGDYLILMGEPVGMTKVESLNTSAAHSS